MFVFDEGEKILKIVRRHYFVMLPPIIVNFVLALAPLMFYLLINSILVPIDMDIKIWLNNFFYEWGSFSYAVWLLFLWVMFFIEWTDYYLDIWVITDKRIIDVEQIGFFNREVTSFYYAQIQDITVETRGFIETFFNFGTLYVATAGHGINIAIKDASNPEEARALILKQSHRGPVGP